MNAYEKFTRREGRKIAPNQPLKRRRKRRSSVKMQARRDAFADLDRVAQRRGSYA